MIDRIGVDINQKLPLERAVAWAIEHKVPYIDLCLDQTPELLEKSSPRLGNARKHLEANGIELGLHTLSAVNIAETSPFVTSAADAYLAAYLEAAQKLGAGWVVVHGGYHFGGDKRVRHGRGGRAHRAGGEGGGKEEGEAAAGKPEPRTRAG